MTDPTQPPGSDPNPYASTDADAPLEGDVEGGAELSKGDRTWGMLCHLCGLTGYLPIIPGLGNVIAPLVIWLIKREEIPFVNDQGKEVINYKITVLIPQVALFFTMFFPIVGCVTALLLVALTIIDIILSIKGTISANSGTPYRYPFRFEFIT